MPLDPLSVRNPFWVAGAIDEIVGPTHRTFSRSGAVPFAAGSWWWHGHVRVLLDEQSTHCFRWCPPLRFAVTSTSGAAARR